MSDSSGAKDEPLIGFFDGRTIGYDNLGSSGHWTWRGVGYDEGWETPTLDDIVTLHRLLGAHLKRITQPPPDGVPDMIESQSDENDAVCDCAPDCAERIACPTVGQVGHFACGWCLVHDKARHLCGCLVYRPEQEQS